jgi:hypothetical protein
MNDASAATKTAVRAYWERETCGRRYANDPDRARYFDEVTAARYRLEPYIPGFANFPGAAGKRMLEIGVGWLTRATCAR